MSIDYQQLREEYLHDSLDENKMHEDPIREFDSWFKKAVALELPLPNAMVLATVTNEGRPNARYVLLKSFDDAGFVFFSHAVSAKGKQLAHTPFASLVFYWSPMHRQIRIEGEVTQVSTDEADEYFATRPYGSRVAVHIADQSSVVESREFMETRIQEIETQFPKDVPRPDTWVGYRVKPDKLEFWQGRENRLHDRVVYEQTSGNQWRKVRLAP